VPVAHAWNSSYSGGRDQEDQDSKPDKQIVPKTLSQKKKNKKLPQNRSGGVAQGIGPSSNPSTTK
jgi:hypothetical protein